MYDCLPSDDAGRPLAASRDANLMQYASSIPRTGLPLLLGGSMLWFPNHTVSKELPFPCDATAVP